MYEYEAVIIPKLFKTDFLLEYIRQGRNGSLEAATGRSVSTMTVNPHLLAMRIRFYYPFWVKLESNRTLFASVMNIDFISHDSHRRV